MNPLSLTFGVEFEFLVRYENNAETQYYVYPVLYRLCSALESIGLAVDPQVPNLANPDYFKWVISTDYSLTIKAPDTAKGEGPPEDPFEGGRWAYMPVEIQSPIFEVKKERWKTEIGRALAAINGTFPGDVIVNDSTGLHVHVGCWYAGFPLTTLKNLGALLLTFERELDRLHPPHRINNLYAIPLRRNSRDGPTEAAIRKIFNEPTVAGLVMLLNPDMCFAYNFWNLGRDKQTIEFRQHKGTVDVGEVVMWVKVVTGLVERASGLTVEETLGIVSTGGGWEGLLGKEAARFYRSRLWEHEYAAIEEEWDDEDRY